MEDQFLYEEKTIIKEKIIKKKTDEDRLDDLLALKDVDKNEIVVFQDKHGKLITINVSIEDLIVRYKTATNNSIDVHLEGKIKPAILRDTISSDIISKVNKIGDTMTGSWS